MIRCLKSLIKTDIYVCRIIVRLYFRKGNWKLTRKTLSYKTLEEKHYKQGSHQKNFLVISFGNLISIQDFHKLLWKRFLQLGFCKKIFLTKSLKVSILPGKFSSHWLCKHCFKFYALFTSRPPFLSAFNLLQLTFCIKLMSQSETMFLHSFIKNAIFFTRRSFAHEMLSKASYQQLKCCLCRKLNGMENGKCWTLSPIAHRFQSDGVTFDWLNEAERS